MQGSSDDGPFELQSVDPGWQSALLFEAPGQIFERVYRLLHPGGRVSVFEVTFHAFANASSRIELRDGAVRVRITDILEGAPAPVIEALAYVLLGKLLRRTVPATYSRRYRTYLNRKDIRQRRHLVRQLRGRKFLSGPVGEHVDLDKVFDRVNAEFFGGLMGKPELGWSRRVSRTLLGHFDPSHNAIIISRVFDQAELPPLALEYVMFHEMLHLRFPVDHSGARRCVHTPEFKAVEKQFPQLAAAKALLKKI